LPPAERVHQRRERACRVDRGKGLNGKKYQSRKKIGKIRVQLSLSTNRKKGKEGWSSHNFARGGRKPAKKTGEKNIPCIEESSVLTKQERGKVFSRLFLNPKKKNLKKKQGRKDHSCISVDESK